MAKFMQNKHSEIINLDDTKNFEPVQFNGGLTYFGQSHKSDDIYHGVENNKIEQLHIL
jgi:hypothetical protein